LKIKSKIKSAQAERRGLCRVLSLDLRECLRPPLPVGERVGVRGRAERDVKIRDGPESSSSPQVAPIPTRAAEETSRPGTH